MSSPLSKGFFQELLDESPSCEPHPVLQVLNCQQITNTSNFKLRLSDGLFSYQYCFLSVDLNAQCVEDRLHEGYAIIRVQRFSINNMGVRKLFNVLGYELVEKSDKQLGNPQPHTGRPQDYRGYTKMQYGKAREPGAQPAHSAHEAMPGTSSTQTVTPVGLITPYISKWRVCGVVSNRTEIREVTSAKGHFKVFSFILTDAKDAAIKINAFNDAISFHQVINNGKAYYISGTGGIKAANKQYNPTQHNYEIFLQKNSMVEPCYDVEFTDRPSKLRVIPLGSISEHVGEIIDVLAVIHTADDATQVLTKKDQKALDKRDLYLVDQSGGIAYTLWGERALAFDKGNVGKVVAIRGATVREFGDGYTLSTSLVSDTQMYYENLPQTVVSELLSWYEGAKEASDLGPSVRGGSTSFEIGLRMIGMAQAHFGELEGSTAYINIAATVLGVLTESAVYKACASRDCFKKVSEEQGRYRCDKCGTSASYKHNFMLSMEVADFTGSTWLTLWGSDLGKSFLGIGPDQLAELKENDPTAYEEVFERVLFQPYEFRVGIKQDVFLFDLSAACLKDQQRQKWSVYDVRPLSHAKLVSVYEKMEEHAQEIRVEMEE